MFLALRAGCCALHVFICPGISDSDAVEQVVFTKGYYFLQELDNFQPKAILDAGGNIGLASMLFALC